jgi:TolB protein
LGCGAGETKNGKQKLETRRQKAKGKKEKGGVLEMKKRRVVFSSVAFLIAGFIFGHGGVMRGATAGALPSRAEDAAAVGIFEKSGDVGGVLHAGSVEYDAAKGSYTIRGSGENMWFGKDEFQFAWKKMSGDVALNADISFPSEGKNPHRKAVLMIRQSLDTDSPYADIALHGVGMTALQYRDEKSALTYEVVASTSAPKHLRIEKRGNYFSMWLAAGDEPLQIAGGSSRVALGDTFYVGIGVCSHEKDLVETAVFSNVQIAKLDPMPAEKMALHSMLETVGPNAPDRTVVYETPGRIEAPNWTHDGGTLLFNRNGRIERMPAGGGKPEAIDTGFATRCNNDHGISPDGKWLVVSDQSQEPHKSLIYILPFAGGTPRRITENSPSYWHGWSPDGKTLAFVGERSGEFDIYSSSTAGGAETRLTTAKGLDDGPEYSPDGEYIYFNSERTGKMDIYRMRPDGREQEPVTSDEYNNWFPHLSPDGTQMVMLSYEKDVKGHPENKDVMLRLMSLKDKKITVLTKLFGGQGTINVPSWSPDGSKLAFVSYTLAAK